MSSDGTEIACALGGLATGAAIAALIMICVGTPDSAWHALAVKHGAAHYVIDDSGETTFVWNDAAEKNP